MKMKTSLIGAFTALCILLSSSSSEAKTRKPSSLKKEPEISRALEFSPYVGIPIIGGHLGIGVGAQLTYALKEVPGLRVGGEIGFYHWGGDDVTMPAFTGTTFTTANYSTSTNAFPLLLSGVYRLPSRFDMAEGRLKFFGAVSTGVAFANASVSSSYSSVSTSSTEFVFLMRPGAEFGGTNGRQFFGELRFGSFAGLFIFQPTFGMNFQF